MELMEACGITCWELHIPAGTSMVQLTLLPSLWELYAAVLLPPRYTFHKVLQPALPQPGLSSVKHLVENRSEHVPRLYDHVCHNLCGWGFQKQFCGPFWGDVLRKTNAFGLCDPMCHSVFTCMFSRYVSKFLKIYQPVSQGLLLQSAPLCGMLSHFGRISRS